jgi:hypothetical protein
MRKQTTTGYIKILWKTPGDIFNSIFPARRLDMQIDIRPAKPEEMDEARRIAEETNVLPPRLDIPGIYKRNNP